MLISYRTLILLLLFLIKTQFIFPQWVQTNGSFGGVVDCFAVSGSTLFAGSGSGKGSVNISTNNGISWNAVNNNLTQTWVNAFAVSDTNLFAGTYNGVYLSTNNGISWNAVNDGLTSYSVMSLAVS
jgi:hypothetical protein